MEETRPNLITSAPLFNVRNLQAAVDYYVEVLGFTRAQLWGDPPTFCMPHRDGLIVMLNQTANAAHICPGHVTGSWDAYFWVHDAEVLFEEFRSKGAFIDYEPCIKESYGIKEFAVKDVDGYLMAFGQDWPGR